MDKYNQLFKRKFRRGIELGFHYDDWSGKYDNMYSEIMSNFDPKQIVASLLRAKVDWCYVWAEALGCYFYDTKDTRLGHKHKSLRGRDFIKKLTEEGKKQGLSILSYSGLNSSRDFARLHPEWVMKDPSGKPVGAAICFNCDEFLGLLKSRSSEIMDNYDINGWFFDGTCYPFTPSPPTCFCENCRSVFRKKYGFDMPTTPNRDETWDKFLEFRYDSNERFTHSLKKYLHSKYPGKIVLFNYHGHIPFDWMAGLRPVGHATISDSTMAEDFGVRMHQCYPSLTASFIAGVSGPDRAFLILTDRFLSGYGDFTLRPEADLKWNAFTLKMRGANVAIIDKIRHDYSVEPAAYERIGKVYGEVRDKEPYFEHPAIKEVGLYYSLRTRDWYDQYNVDKVNRCVVGAYRALVDLHYQVEFLFDESVTLKRLQQFPVIYLPNIAILSTKEVQMFRQYVAAGGSLFATWETGLYDQLGRPLEDFALRDILGCRYVRHTKENWNFVRFAKGQWTQDVLGDHDIPAVEQFPVIFESDGAQTFGELRIALPGGIPGGTAGCSPWKTVGPALAIHRFGKGRSAYLCAPIDGEYSSQRAMAEHRNLIRNVIRYLHPNRQVTVQAPLNVEVVVMRDNSKEEIIVHLVGFWPRKNVKTHWLAPAPTTECMEEPALYRATITVEKKIRNARAFDSQTRVETVGNNVRIETQQVHEAIIISF